MKQNDAGLRKNRISLLRDMVMQMAPITIRNRLNRANMAAATFRSARGRRAVLQRVEVGGVIWSTGSKNLLYFPHCDLS